MSFAIAQSKGVLDILDRSRPSDKSHDIFDNGLETEPHLLGPESDQNERPEKNL